MNLSALIRPSITWIQCVPFKGKVIKKSYVVEKCCVQRVGCKSNNKNNNVLKWKWNLRIPEINTNETEGCFFFSFLKRGQAIFLYICTYIRRAAFILRTLGGLFPWRDPPLPRWCLCVCATDWRTFALNVDTETFPPFSTGPHSVSHP